MRGALALLSEKFLVNSRRESWREPQKKGGASHASSRARRPASFRLRSCRDVDALTEPGVAEPACGGVWTECRLDAPALLSLDAREGRSHRLAELSVGPG